MQIHPNVHHCFLQRGFVAVLSVLAHGAVSGGVLDNFAGATKTGWTDALNGGTVAQAGGQLNVATATGNGALTYSAKTSAAFTNLAGHTLEFRVDVNQVTPGGGDPNPTAILGWVPVGSTLSAGGYSLAVSASSVRLQKGAAVLYATNAAVQNTNVTLVLRLTPAGSAVSVNVRVYKQVPNGAIGQAFTELFARTVADPLGVVGVGGNAVLGVANQAAPAGSTAAFASLQVFEVSNSRLDTFSSGPSSAWASFMKHPTTTDSVTPSGAQVEFIAGPDSLGGFAGMYYTGKTFKVSDGGRVEFSVDVLRNAGSRHSYAVLGYLPGGGLASIFQLIEYHLATDPANTYNGKAYNEWWGHTTGSFPEANFRLSLSLTGEGPNCRVESRAEDLSVDVNDPGRVFYQAVFVDTPAKDPGLNEQSATQLPYMNVDGNFLIDTFNDSSGTADITFANPAVNQTFPPNAAPVLSNLSPALGADFVAAGNHLVFDLTDEVNVVSNSILLTLNGALYTNGSPGVTLTPATGTAATRHFDLAGVLAPNVNYTGSIRATDPLGATSVTPIAFDTFLPNTYILESEEYNFSPDNGATGGAYLDNPKLISENNADANAYNGQPGLAEVDFHDNRGPHNGYDANHTFRTLDPVYTAQSSDPPRAKYLAAGGAAAGFFEEEVTDIRDGDWMNYTRHYPAGVYNVYLRQAQYLMPLSLVTLDQVTSDPTVGNQTTVTLGAFLGQVSGTGQFRNVPLTDGLGNPIALRLDGSLKTFRLSQRVTGNANDSVGILEQNYLAFVPATDTGKLRPMVASAQPLPGTVVLNDSSGAVPATRATIANRDTTVKTNTIALQINGLTVPITLASASGGTEVAWSFASVPGAPALTNTLSFQDSDGTNLSASWTYSYPFLSASNSLPPSALTDRGWDYRMVQAASVGGAGNSLGTAEQQLTSPPQIPFDQTFATNAQLLYWSDGSIPGAGPAPGLAPGVVPNIACEMFGYLHLTAGAHRFYVRSDDGFQLRSGSTLREVAATVLGFRDGGTINGTFDFVVEADGLYPTRCLWYQHGGAYYFELDSVNLADNSHVLINDPSNPTGVVQVYLPYYPVDLLSSPTVNGAYTVDPAGVLNRDARTITVPVPASTRFYKIRGPSSTKITARATASSIVLSYRFQ